MLLYLLCLEEEAGGELLILVGLLLVIDIVVVVIVWTRKEALEVPLHLLLEVLGLELHARQELLFVGVHLLLLRALHGRGERCRYFLALLVGLGVPPLLDIGVDAAAGRTRLGSEAKVIEAALPLWRLAVISSLVRAPQQGCLCVLLLTSEVSVSFEADASQAAGRVDYVWYDIAILIDCSFGFIELLNCGQVSISSLEFLGSDVLIYI